MNCVVTPFYSLSIVFTRLSGTFTVRYRKTTKLITKKWPNIVFVKINKTLNKYPPYSRSSLFSPHLRGWSRSLRWLSWPRSWLPLFGAGYNLPCHSLCSHPRAGTVSAGWSSHCPSLQQRSLCCCPCKWQERNVCQEAIVHLILWI